MCTDGWAVLLRICIALVLHNSYSPELVVLFTCHVNPVFFHSALGPCDCKEVLKVAGSTVRSCISLEKCVHLVA